MKRPYKELGFLHTETELQLACLDKIKQMLSEVHTGSVIFESICFRASGGIDLILGPREHNVQKIECALGVGGIRRERNSRLALAIVTMSFSFIPLVTGRAQRTNLNWLVLCNRVN